MLFQTQVVWVSIQISLWRLCRSLTLSCAPWSSKHLLVWATCFLQQSFHSDLQPWDRKLSWLHEVNYRIRKQLSPYSFSCLCRKASCHKPTRASLRLALRRFHGSYVPLTRHSSTFHTWIALPRLWSCLHQAFPLLGLCSWVKCPCRNDSCHCPLSTSWTGTQRPWNPQVSLSTLVRWPGSHRLESLHYYCCQHLNKIDRSGI